MNCEINRITIKDKEYPDNLKNIYDPPETLYVRGSIVPEDAIAIAIVGTRLASYYGLSTAERLAYNLALKGVTIVSGMARGIDTSAHRGALNAKGRTIAVLGSGLNCIYPQENEKLAEMIYKSGAVISEFTQDTVPYKGNFPRRNRLISGLSLGVVVVEAGLTSGALITANLALEQGREVFSVPGQANTFNAKGTHRLLREGAKLVENADDILEELEPILKDKIKRLNQQHLMEEVNHRPAGGEGSIARKDIVLSEDEDRIYGFIFSHPTPLEEIIEQGRLHSGRATAILTILEVKGLIKQLEGKMFIRTG